MSISSEIARIEAARDDSFDEIAAKGVTVPSGSTIDDLPALIRAIPTGQESVIALTPSVSKSSGASSFDSGEAWRAGHTVFLKLAFKSGNSSVSTGNNTFTGTLSGVPLPPTGAIGLGYLGSTVLIGNLSDDGTLIIRVAGAAKAASSSNIFGVSWTYLTRED